MGKVAGMGVGGGAAGEEVLRQLGRGVWAAGKRVLGQLRRGCWGSWGLHVVSRPLCGLSMWAGVGILIAWQP